MNALAAELLAVAKQYLGPAAPAFLSKELHALGTNANAVDSAQITPLAERARQASLRLMDPLCADEFATKLAACGLSPNRATAPSRGHRLAANAAASLLEHGKLRQAETAYRELVKKHGDPESYRGLARTLVALDDQGAALVTLRDGAAALARKGDRTGAVALLVDAVRTVPTDLAAHRRLAAALANQGDLIGACEEYARFVDVALAQHDTRRALIELAYGRETLGDLSALLALADRVMAAQGAAPAQTPPPRRIIPAGPPAAAPQPQARLAAPPNAEPPMLKTLAFTRPMGAATAAVVLQDAQTLTHAEHADLGLPLNLLERTAPRNKVVFAARPSRPSLDLEAQLATLIPKGTPGEATSLAISRATLLIAAHDPRATEAALDAARRALSLKMLQAASDLLLGYIGAGFPNREAQRLLIEVDCGLGRRDVAREKCHLLGEAYRLDGELDVAADVERLAGIL